METIEQYNPIGDEDTLRLQLRELNHAKDACFRKLLADPSNKAYLESRKDLMRRIGDIKRKLKALQSNKSVEAKPWCAPVRIPLKLK